jgi:CheY-like chemotaxis protein
MSDNKIFMLIDDDQDDRFLFSMAVKECCPEAVCYLASDGAAALSLLREPERKKPDVVFLDINMPGMGGWECLDTLKMDDELKQIPVIMYSTSSLSEDVKRARSKGAECFCVKPEDYDDLRKLIRYVSENAGNGLRDKLSANNNFRFLYC